VDEIDSAFDEIERGVKNRSVKILRDPLATDLHRTVETARWEADGGLSPISSD